MPFEFSEPNKSLYRYSCSLLAPIWSILLHPSPSINTRTARHALQKIEIFLDCLAARPKHIAPRRSVARPSEHRWGNDRLVSQDQNGHDCPAKSAFTIP